METKQDHEQQEFMSINELLEINRQKYPNRNKVLFHLHMLFLLSWLTIRHGDCKTIIGFGFTLIYEAYIHYKVFFISVMAFLVYWIAMNLKAGAIAGCVVLIICLAYKGFKQFGKDIGE